jgi:hypothetical protein
LGQQEPVQGPRPVARCAGPAPHERVGVWVVGCNSGLFRVPEGAHVARDLRRTHAWVGGWPAASRVQGSGPVGGKGARATGWVEVATGTGQSHRPRPKRPRPEPLSPCPAVRCRPAGGTGTASTTPIRLGGRGAGRGRPVVQGTAGGQGAAGRRPPCPKQVPCPKQMCFTTVTIISIRTTKFRMGLFNDDRLAG